MRQFLDSVAIPKVTSEFNPAAVLMEQELSNLYSSIRSGGDCVVV